MSTVITRVLAANRGEIARRIFRACRRSGIGCVAVFSDPDAGAPHVAEADAAVRLPGFRPADTYLNAAALVAAAVAAGADAVHPGYGFLSEDAGFARAVRSAGLTWIGPPADAIEVMGSKITSKKLAAAAGVPVLPELAPGAITGYPVLVKASAGGGGRGMRVVRSAADLPAALESARREAQSAFGDGTVFCEPLLTAARHVEVQVLADAHGAIWTLTERDCSVQRRYQKVIEETPSPAVGEPVRARLLAAAEAVTSAVGYLGAGTAEFLVADDGQFFFLEFNTRLQVEHPVTECVHGIDLVALQLDIARGLALPQRPPAASGHAIEARLYAEDPADGYRPSSGPLHALHIPDVDTRFGPPAPGAGQGLRLDSGVEAGSEISPHYDPMLAKLIAWAPARDTAARLLASALDRATIHGPATNRGLLASVLRHRAFLAGQADTSLLDGYDLAGLAPSRPGLAVRDRRRPRGRRGEPVRGAGRGGPARRLAQRGLPAAAHVLRRPAGPDRGRLPVAPRRDRGDAGRGAGPGRDRLAGAGRGRGRARSRSTRRHWRALPVRRRPGRRRRLGRFRVRARHARPGAPPARAGGHPGARVAGRADARKRGADRGRRRPAGPRGRAGAGPRGDEDGAPDRGASRRASGRGAGRPRRPGAGGRRAGHGGRRRHRLRAHGFRRRGGGSMNDLVRYESDREVTTITLDSPGRRNALSSALLIQLRAALADALADPGCRVVVLTGADPAFCAGADLKESRTGPAAAPELFPEILQLIWDSRKPVICRVNGNARAGGIGLIAACDIAVASQSATFAFSEVRIGAAPAIIAVPCLRRMSPRAAAEYFLTGEAFDAQRAVDIGLLTSAVPKIQLDEEIARYTDSLLRGAPGALGVTKAVLRDAATTPFATGLAEMAALSAERFASAEGQQGMAAFAEKREPSWVRQPPGDRP